MFGFGASVKTDAGGELASWDFEMLSAELEKLNIDMSKFGFEDVEEVDVDEFFELKPQEQKEKQPEIITCPHCGQQFER